MSYNLLTRFPDSYREPLQAAADESGDSLNLIVVEAVAQYLREQHRQVPSLAKSGRVAVGVPASPTPYKRHVVLAASEERY